MTGKFFVFQPPPYGTTSWEQWWEDFNRNWEDLSCDETLDPSDQEDESPSKRRKTDSQQSTFTTTPPKTSQGNPTNIPEDLHSFVSSAIYTNRTYSAFLVYTTVEKGPVLYQKLLAKFKAMFVSEHKNSKGERFILIMTGGKHRVSAILNYCRHNCTVSFCIVKAVCKAYELYYYLCKGSYELVQQSNDEGLKMEEFNEGEQKEKLLDWKALCEFAVSIECDDPLLLMGHYLNFASPLSSCVKCNKGEKFHVKHHAKQHENAKLFVSCKTQKNSCMQACDWVLANRRLMTRTATREELMIQKFQKMFRKLDDLEGDVDILDHMAGVAWLSLICTHFDDLIVDIIKLLCENTPKKRNVLFVGPFNSGKTTVAAGISDLLNGTTLNVNCAPEKLNFELGCAIDRYMVVFEDVKGSAQNDLLPGPGVMNLDNCRDYLDGCVPVNLERKHCNKQSQTFPPCIATMNHYNLPFSLKTRFAKTVTFTCKDYLKKSLDKNKILLKKRIVQSGKTLLLLLCWWQPLSAFHESVHENVKYWKETLYKYCSMAEFNKMTINIQNGMDPLEGILETETENNDNNTDSVNTDTSHDSGLESTQSTQ